MLSTYCCELGMIPVMTSVNKVSFERPPLLVVAFYDKPGIYETNSKPDSTGILQ